MINPKVIAINGCHDASVTFVDKFGRLRIFEEDAFYVLENTQLDFLVIEGILFKK